MKNPILEHVLESVEVIRSQATLSGASLSDMLTLSNLDATVAVAFELREANRLAEAAALRQKQANLIAYANLLHSAGMPLPDTLMTIINDSMQSKPASRNVA